MKSSETPLNKGRIYYLDVLRFLSCLAVILIHTASLYIIKDFGSLNHRTANILDSLSRFAVPVFVMISGSLMLDGGYEFTKEKWLKHIKKTVIFFVFWSAACALFYNVVKPILTHGKINIAEALRSFIHGATHLWFIYMIIGLYLILPLLRLWVKKENKKQVEYFIILATVFAFIIPQTARIGGLYSDSFGIIGSVMNMMNLKYVGGYTTYFILGWYLHNFELKNKKLIYALGAVSLLGSIAATEIIAKTTGNPDIIYDSLTINVLLYSAAVFVLVKSVIEKLQPEKQNKLVMSVSKYSLGIYAVHPVPIVIVSTILLKFGIDNALINIPVIFLISFVFSFAVSLIFSKLPFLKKVV